MTQPPGFVDSSRPHYVYRLQKALYGLKQAPRAWFSKLSTALLAGGFTQYDIIITGSSSDFVTGLIGRLHSQFALKDLGQCDADWAGYPDDRRSTTGYCVFLGPNVISWSSKKQHTVARSSTEAEYRALAHTAAELRWITSVLHELHITLTCPPSLWCDNIGATYLAVNPVFHQCTKHLEIDLHFIRDMVLAGTLHVRYVSTTLQIADILTKGLSSSRFDTLRSKLHVDSPRSAGGGILADIFLRGYCGWNSRQAVQVLDEVFPKDDAIQPSLVIVYFGGNDSVRPRPDGLSSHVSLSEYVENMRKISIHLKSLSEKTRVIFLTAPPVNEAQLLQVLGVDGRKNELCQKYADACEKLCQEIGIKAINLCNAFKQHDNWMTTCFT
ncbi:putative RNA-directed DNA polymerase [Helianthus anomalus]